VVVFIPCRLLNRINIVVSGLNRLLSCATMFFIFVIFGGVLALFSISRFEEFFIDSFYVIGS
jgi:hypothetical protein